MNRISQLLFVGLVVFFLLLLAATGCDAKGLGPTTTRYTGTVVSVQNDLVTIAFDDPTSIGFKYITEQPGGWSYDPERPWEGATVFLCGCRGSMEMSFVNPPLLSAGTTQVWMVFDVTQVNPFPPAGYGVEIMHDTATNTLAVR